MSFEALRGASRTTAHSTLMDRLAAYDDLFVADIAIHSTDDALRLLRVIDDLYTRPDAPRFHFSARQPPSAWFRVEDQGAGIAGDIAEKFTRTTSRLQALCTMQHPPSASARS
jgi:cell division protein ZapE